MEAPHEALRRSLGQVGVWTFAFDSMGAEQIRQASRRIEAMGFGALWIPEGSSSREVFSHLSLLAAATNRITVASGIANITSRHPVAMAQGSRTLAEAYPGRILIGIGVGHQYSTARRGLDWTDPIGRMRDYLERMDETPWAGPKIIAPRVLAALGPRMIEVSAELALGAHTYFVPVEHTSWARKRLGEEPLLAVELTVVIDEDTESARAKAREWARGYLELPNYANNWRRMGFSDDEVAGGGSDRLIDAGIACGTPEVVADRARSHLEAGADHVCIQVLGEGELGALEQVAPLVLAT
jgi:probable F420-dependent oxidoreductase